LLTNGEYWDLRELYHPFSDRTMESVGDARKTAGRNHHHVEPVFFRIRCDSQRHMGANVSGFVRNIVKMFFGNAVEFLGASADNTLAVQLAVHKVGVEPRINEGFDDVKHRDVRP